jgi:hypothetical protein
MRCDDRAVRWGNDSDGRLMIQQALEPEERPPARFLFEGQPQHLMLLAVLLPGALQLAASALDGSHFASRSDSWWLSLLLGVVVVHQLVVWFVFRMQIVYGLLTRLFGRFDMMVWAAMFVPLLVARPALTVALGIADAGSLGLPTAVRIPLGMALLAPAVYTGWSVARYFGFARALGGDHFRRHYRDMPPVRQGAFKYSSNAMYAFAFLALWSIAVLTDSRAALAAALFQHAYIWVHMYCTEAPDMRVLYGSSGGRAVS